MDPAPTLAPAGVEPDPVGDITVNGMTGHASCCVRKLFYLLSTRFVSFVPSDFQTSYYIRSTVHIVAYCMRFAFLIQMRIPWLRGPLNSKILSWPFLNYQQRVVSHFFQGPQRYAVSARCNRLHRGVLDSRDHASCIMFHELHDLLGHLGARVSLPGLLNDHRFRLAWLSS